MRGVKCETQSKKACGAIRQREVQTPSTKADMGVERECEGVCKGRQGKPQRRLQCGEFLRTEVQGVIQNWK